MASAQSSSPFQTAEQMEQTQISSGALRALRSGRDEDDEAYYRSAIYCSYTNALEAYLGTNTPPTTPATLSIPVHARLWTQAWLDTATAELCGYTDLIISFGPNGYVDAPSHTLLDQLKQMTAAFGTNLYIIFGEQLADTVKHLSTSLATTIAARIGLLAAMDKSSHDGFLNFNQCAILAQTLAGREYEMDQALDDISAAIALVMGQTQRICEAAADTLDSGILQGTRGIKNICSALDGLGDKILTMRSYLDDASELCEDAAAFE